MSEHVVKFLFFFRFLIFNFLLFKNHCVYYSMCVYVCMSIGKQCKILLFNPHRQIHWGRQITQSPIFIHKFGITMLTRGNTYYSEWVKTMKIIAHQRSLIHSITHSQLLIIQPTNHGSTCAFTTCVYVFNINNNIAITLCNPFNWSFASCIPKYNRITIPMHENCFSPLQLDFMNETLLLCVMFSFHFGWLSIIDYLA